MHRTDRHGTGPTQWLDNRKDPMTTAKTPASKQDLHDFKEFLKLREKASLAFVNGDIAPLDAVSTHTSPATIFGPAGDYVEGARKVNSANAEGAAHFQPEGESKFEVLQIAAEGDVAWWAGIQRASVRAKGKPNAAPMDLRVTEAFRREDGEWKLVHRHADPLKSEPEDKSK